MRLHSLEATAFGPFADTVHVDFDHLSDAGLFLLSGPTGAGKTSVLDAVCFALYGDVPGDRSAAKRLRCDQAAPGVAPRVTLETTLLGRRFRIARSPAWERPKKRGSGTTAQQASVTLSERVGGEWVPLSSRLDEAGHLVSRLLGMNLAQFTQVAMLPQGRFQAFLRARSEERHQLLQQLFRTGRFEDVERWLRDRKNSLRRASESAREQVADLVSRVSEATGVAAPEVDETPESIGPWAVGLREAATGESARASLVAAAATESEASARAALEAGRVLAERRVRLASAADEHRRLLEAAAEREAARVRLDDARRAAGVVPLEHVAVRARRVRAAAQTAVARLEVDDRPTLEAALAEAVDGAARVRALQPRAVRLRQVRVEITRLETRLVQLADAQVRARADAVALVESL